MPHEPLWALTAGGAVVLFVEASRESSFLNSPGLNSAPFGMPGSSSTSMRGNHSSSCRHRSGSNLPSTVCWLSGIVPVDEAAKVRDNCCPTRMVKENSCSSAMPGVGSRIVGSDPEARPTGSQAPTSTPNITAAAARGHARMPRRARRLSRGAASPPNLHAPSPRPSVGPCTAFRRPSAGQRSGRPLLSRPGTARGSASALRAAISAPGARR